MQRGCAWHKHKEQIIEFNQMIGLMSRFNLSPKEVKEIEDDDKMNLLMFIRGEGMAKKKNG
jgi:hypothetical protein